MDHDVFYDTAKLSRSEQEDLLRKAHSICERWWFDKLDCSESFARQRVKDISFEDAMDHRIAEEFRLGFRPKNLQYPGDVGSSPG